jgi:hypothetical protein
MSVDFANGSRATLGDPGEESRRVATLLCRLLVRAFVEGNASLAPRFRQVPSAFRLWQRPPTTMFGHLWRPPTVRRYERRPKVRRRHRRLTTFRRQQRPPSVRHHRRPPRTRHRLRPPKTRRHRPSITFRPRRSQAGCRRHRSRLPTTMALPSVSSTTRIQASHRYRLGRAQQNSPS